MAAWTKVLDQGNECRSLRPCLNLAEPSSIEDFWRAIRTEIFGRKTKAGALIGAGLYLFSPRVSYGAVPLTKCMIRETSSSTRNM
jgi:hypothetical protein